MTIHQNRWAGDPVPEPVTMMLLEMGLVGATMPGRQKIFKKKE